MARTASLLGDKWTLLILRDLSQGRRRFVDLKGSVEGINPRTLSDRLKRLEAGGFVRREAFRELPPRVEYSLTEQGAALIPLIDFLRAYGERWLTARAAPCYAESERENAADRSPRREVHGRGRPAEAEKGG